MSRTDLNQPSDSAALRIACIGGGPGGLFTAIAMAHSVPAATVDVFERNRESDVFGFGVVFSDATLDHIDTVDPVLRDTLADHGRRWDTIEVRAKGETMAAGGNGMSAVHRRVLLGALRERALELGARLHHSADVTVDELDARGDFDLIVAADGTNSAAREAFIDKLDHSVETAAVKFIWFGTTYQFERLTFLHMESEHGNFAVHAYPIGSDLSTFIVETDEQTWRRAGLDGFDMSSPPGESDEVTKQYLESLFAQQIDGHKLVTNNSRWSNFRTRRTRHWHTRTDRGTPVAFLGDAMHTAHFSVGSGTKMAMEDAAALAQSIAEHPSDLETAMAAFQDARRPQVAKIQNSSIPSLSWWDHFGEYYRGLEPWQFGFHFFSRAISAAKMGVRDPAFVRSAHEAWEQRHGASPLATHLTIGATEFATRLLEVIDETEDTLTLGSAGQSLTAGSDSGHGPVRLYLASDTEGTSLPATATTRLDELCGSKPDAVVVRGGTPLSRVLSAERVRLRYGIPVVVVDGPDSVRARRAVDENDCAATLILSGRADAVAFEVDAESRVRNRVHAEVAK
ncbi:FAD-dependent monooxygenase [Williamsia soli]|uniref:FAD-dependent monooxygenase n=1 Tax=Williamsia soli TaxID=364929 RepID=UPI001A9E331A|nr:FAD-dependent monooxygenase [Williamsia soli]